MSSFMLRGFVLIAILAVVLPTLYALTTSDDKYWHDRMLEAREANNKAAHPDPLKETHHFNLHAHRRMQATNLTRISRHLGGTEGCRASNPIDKCWRCDKNWEANRKKLASCVMGFGRKTTGGAAGKIYVVTDASDNDLVEPKPGTLRYGCLQPKPLWIIFKQNMNIKLKGELMLTPDKTIDGRGAKVHIANGGSFNIFLTKNIIIHGLHIHNIVPLSGGTIRDSPIHKGRRGRADGDAIGIFGSSNVWIDHVSFSNCEDGLVDVINGSTAITVSNCHFTKHDHVMLLGASDANTDDTKMQVTVAYNHFDKGLVQRMPRCRSGFFHVVNNDYTEWEMYAIGGTHNPTIMSQGNRFYAPSNPNAKQVTSQNKGCTKSEWKNWKWTSQGDLLENGAIFIQSGGSASHGGPEMMKPLPAKGIAAITASAGALDCVPNKPC